MIFSLPPFSTRQKFEASPSSRGINLIRAKLPRESRMGSTSDSATSVESSKKSMDFAKKELRSLLGKMDELGLPVRAWRLLRARSRLKPTRMRLRARHLWILLIATWMTLHVARNRAHTYRHSKVREKERERDFYFGPMHSFLVVDFKLASLLPHAEKQIRVREISAERIGSVWLKLAGFCSKLANGDNCCDS